MWSNRNKAYIWKSNQIRDDCLASSLDQGGVVARSAADAALILEAMCGHDLKPTSLNLERPDLTTNLNNPIKGMRQGLPKEFFEKERFLMSRNQLKKQFRSTKIWGKNS